MENTFTGEKIIDAFQIDSNGEYLYLDLVNYANILNNSPKIKQDKPEQISLKTIQEGEEVSPQSEVNIIFTYRETNTYVGLGSAIKVTPDVVGPTQLSYGESVSISESYGGDISITYAIKQKINAGASFNWNKTTTTASNFGFSYEIPDGKTGYIQFRPRFNVTEGIITETVYSSLGGIIDTYEFNAWGQCGIKLSTGFADGVYERVLY